MRDWDNHFLLEAYHAAGASKDPSSQVGAVIVGPDREPRSRGYNGPCRGEDDSNPAIFERPLKYELSEHAERNALYNAARIGVPCRGCTMYATLDPCTDCARGIIQSGISELVLHREAPRAPGWAASQGTALAMLERCGVKVRWWSGHISMPRGVRVGEVWHEL